MREMRALFEEIDVLVMPSFGNPGLSVSNLTGHPCVTLPHHFAAVEGAPAGSTRRNPESITFLGGMYRDDMALALADHYQGLTDFHRRRPPIK